VEEKVGRGGGKWEVKEGGRPDKKRGRRRAVVFFSSLKFRTQKFNMYEAIKQITTLHNQIIWGNVISLFLAVADRGEAESQVVKFG
jgi:hypothetical protein